MLRRGSLRRRRRECRPGELRWTVARIHAGASSALQHPCLLICLTSGREFGERPFLLLSSWSLVSSLVVLWPEVPDPAVAVRCCSSDLSSSTLRRRSRRSRRESSQSRLSAQRPRRPHRGSARRRRACRWPLRTPGILGSRRCTRSTSHPIRWWSRWAAATPRRDRDEPPEQIVVAALEPGEGRRDVDPHLADDVLGVRDRDTVRAAEHRRVVVARSSTVSRRSLRNITALAQFEAAARTFRKSWVCA